MQTILTILTASPYIDLPYHWIGWMGWVVFAAFLCWPISRIWTMKAQRPTRWWFILGILIVLVPISAFFLGFRFTEGQTLPVPDIPSETSQPVVMILAALPWVLAGGILGEIPAAGLGLFAGLFTSLWVTHNLFTPLETGGMALLMAFFMRQRYRTLFFKILRHPIAAAISAIFLFVPIFFAGVFFGTNGTAAARIDYAIVQTWPTVLARGGEILLAALVGEALFFFKFDLWGAAGGLIPSPGETSIEKRFLFVSTPMIVVLFLTLTIGDWIVAGNAAQQMIHDRLASTAQMASNGLPYFLETGQSLISSLADPSLMSVPPEQMRDALARRLRSVPYFRQLFLFDLQGKVQSGYPQISIADNQLSREEQTGIQYAVKGVPVQVYTVSPNPGETVAQVSFIASIHDSNNNVIAVLLGRTDLISNPFSSPAVEVLKSIQDIGGEGVILDENQRIIYDPNPAMLMTGYSGRIPTSAEFFSESAPTGARRLVYYQPVLGRPWSILLTVPAEQAQQLALNIAIPLLAILLILSALALFALRFSLRALTGSLKTLSREATSIAQGQLENPLPVSGSDEIGQLGQMFEQMRISLKARLEELNRLLLVSQGVASNLEIDDAAQSILEAVISEGISSARIVLPAEVKPESGKNQLVLFGLGELTDEYAYLDGQLFDLMRGQAMISIQNAARMRRLTIPIGAHQPGALLALALHHESNYYGVLWIAYEQAHIFSTEQLRFLNTLASEAAVAAANARLYSSAEIGRQTLEAVLSSTPEPVLVIDDQDRLFLFNDAALQVSGMVMSLAPGANVRKVIQPIELVEFLTTPLEGRLSVKEISFSNGRTFQVSLSSVSSDGRSAGKVCIMQDITRYKELDALKSDFVATVSHDLRSPLSLIRGYATMLQMMGEMNDQQKSYLHKIVSGVESMAQLVNNLLDLGRIESGIGLQLDKVMVDEVLDNIINIFQPQALQKKISLTLAAESQKGLILDADSALLQQALYNLVDNAVRFTGLDGKVEIKVEERQFSDIFEIHDSGIGIAPIDLPRVFEKFYRSGRHDANVQRGTGLGLAIVRSIADRHEGKVWVESQLGKGSVFFLEIPKQPQHEN